MSNQVAVSNELTAKVLNDAKWIPEQSIDALKLIPAVPQTPTHQPINHGVALEMFKGIIDTRNIQITASKGLVSQDNNKFMFIADIRSNDCLDYVLNFGFVNFNDRSKSFTIILGERVMVCSNECFGGQLDDLNRRHIGNGVVKEVFDRINVGTERFQQFADTRHREIETLKRTEFTDDCVGDALLSFHRAGSTISNSNIGRIVKEYDKPSHSDFEGRSGWSFLNACTETFKGIDNPLQAIKAQTLASDTVNRITGVNNLDVIDIEPMIDDNGIMFERSM